MAAKHKFEGMVQLNHQVFEWTEPSEAKSITFAAAAEPKQLRKSLLGLSHMIQEKYYPDLPDDLKPFHVWLSDSGHSIMAVPSQFWNETSKNPKDDYEVALPVKYVLEKGYTIRNDYVFVDAPYDPIFGVDLDDDEYQEF